MPSDTSNHIADTGDSRSPRDAVSSRDVVSFAEDADDVLVGTEVATAGSTILDTLGVTQGGVRARSNPDSVVRRKGFSYLREMEQKNGFLYGVLRTRQQSLLSKRWEVQPASDDPHDMMIAAFVQDSLERIEGSFMDDLRCIGSAIRYGYSVSELVWEPWSTHAYGDRLTLRAIKDKAPDQFTFSTDAYGNVIGLNQQQGAKTRSLPLGKFVHFAFEAEAENPYGHGLLSRCYWHDWFMREGWKFWAVYLERFGSPLVRATVPPGTKQSERDDLQRVIESIQQRTGVVIPEGFALDFVEATRNGIAGYREFIEEQKEAIAIVVLGQTLTTYVGQRGSQALGNVHQNTKNDIIIADAEALATLVNEQIVRRLVDANFAGVDRYPVWMWQLTSVDDLEAFARILTRLRGSGMDVPVEWVSRTFGIRLPRPGERVLGGDPEVAGSEANGGVDP
jgi:phage gp29-like protein